METPGETDDLRAAIDEFQAALPGWWFSLGKCSVSCHASAGPDFQWDDRPLLAIEGFDDGFHADIGHPSSLGDALRDVLRQGLAARAVAIQELA